jgi:transposase
VSIYIVTIELLTQRVSNLESENRLLREKVNCLLKKLFGGNKNEKINPAQLELLIAGLESQIAEEEAKKQEEKVSRERNSSGGRHPLPLHLETEEIVIEPQEVKNAPQDWKHIGNEVTQELDLIPAKFIKRLYIRRKYVSKLREDLIVIGELPNRLIDKGIPGVGLLTHVVLGKFADHLPLYRQEKIFAERYGIEISRKTMTQWMRVVADWLKPIYEVMRSDLMKGNYLQVDETPIKYLDRDEIEGSRQGYLWSYGRPRADVIFDWRTGRSREGPLEFLQGFKGLLQCDGYKAYDSLAREREGIVLIGCWAHARRKFVEAMEDSSKRSGFIVHLIAKLYQTEKDLRSMGGVDRKAYRQEKNAQVLRVMEKLLLRWKPKVPPQSLFGKAITYALGQWESLIRVMEHAEVEIDNNLCENSIRPSALGKKNWLFVGHPDAGWRTAVIYSILQSCRRHGVEPQEYLTDVLTRLPNMMITEIRILTPSNWKTSRSVLARAA